MDAKLSVYEYRNNFHSWTTLQNTRVASLYRIKNVLLRLKKEQAMKEFCLAAKFLTKRTLSVDAIANTFQPLWQSKNGFKNKNMGNHRVLFTFNNRN